MIVSDMRNTTGVDVTHLKKEEIAASDQPGKVSPRLKSVDLLRCDATGF
jgi:hypothetical protein